MSLRPFSFRFKGLSDRFPLSGAFPILGLLIGAGLVAGLLGCREARPRIYSEAAFKPNPGSTGKMDGAMGSNGGMPPMMNASPVDIKVTWMLPEGWMIKDSANGMRVGSFSVPDPELRNTGEMDPSAVDVSVVQLAGDAGGLKANITRWMGQIGIKATPDEMDALIKSSGNFKTESGQAGMLVDLTDKLSGDMTQSKSIYGAIVATTDYTVFVKAMGERERVIKIKSEVKAFCESLTITVPKT